MKEERPTVEVVNGHLKWNINEKCPCCGMHVLSVKGKQHTPIMPDTRDILDAMHGAHLGDYEEAKTIANAIKRMLDLWIMKNSK